MSRSRQGNYEKSGLDEKRGEKPDEVRDTIQCFSSHLLVGDSGLKIESVTDRKRSR